MMNKHPHKLMLVIIVVLATLSGSQLWSQISTAADDNAAEIPAATATVQPDETAAAANEPAADTSQLNLEGYVGKITGDRVNIRSGPAAIYHPVGKFAEGQEVIVREERMGQTNWARIEPTPQCFSYIAKQYVRLDELMIREVLRTMEASQPEAETGTTETGKTAETAPFRPVNAAEMTATELNRLIETIKQPIKGIVTGDYVRVRAGSIKALPENAVVQMQLNKGAGVQVIGQRGDFYKIVPPKGSFFWVALDFVEEARPLTADDLQLLRPQAGQSIIAGKAPTSPAEQMNEFQAYRDIVESFQAEQTQPLKQRDFRDIRTRLTGLIQNATSTTVKNAAQSLSDSIAQVESTIRLYQQSLAQDEELEETLTAINQRVQEVVQLTMPGEDEDNQPVVIKGRLAQSAVFTAPLKRKRYLVLDDQDNIMYYAVAGRDHISLEPYVGDMVSMIGNIRFDTFAKVRIIEVSSIVDLPSLNTKPAEDEE